MFSTDNGKKVIHLTNSVSNFIKNNWNDFVGKEYVNFLEQVLNKLKGIEQKKEGINQRVDYINGICEEIIASDNGNNKKGKTLIKEKRPRCR